MLAAQRPLPSLTGFDPIPHGQERQESRDILVVDFSDAVATEKTPHVSFAADVLVVMVSRL